MLPLILQDSDRVALEQFLSCSPSAKACCRAQAVLWLAQGLSVEAIAGLLAVHRRTVYRWAHHFTRLADRSLAERLADAPRSGRPAIALGIIDPLIDEVIDADPQDFGYRYTTWTADLLRQYLQEAHGIAVSRKSVSRALDRLGIRWKRPRYILAERPETWRQAKGGLKKGSLAARARCC